MSVNVDAKVPGTQM